MEAKQQHSMIDEDDAVSAYPLGKVVVWIQKHQEPIVVGFILVTAIIVVTLAIVGYYFYKLAKDQKDYVQQRIQHSESFFFLPCFRLVVCIVLDGIGALWALVPGFGQLVGVYWGSLSALVLWALFLSKNNNAQDDDDPLRRRKNERWRHLLLIAFGWFEESVPIPLIGAIPTGLMIWIHRYWPVLGYWTWRVLQYCQTKIETKLKRRGIQKEE